MELIDDQEILIESLPISNLLNIRSKKYHEMKEEEYHANELVKLIYKENIGELMDEDELKRIGLDPKEVRIEKDEKKVEVLIGNDVVGNYPKEFETNSENETSDLENELGDLEKSDVSTSFKKYDDAKEVINPEAKKKFVKDFAEKHGLTPDNKKEEKIIERQVAEPQKIPKIPMENFPINVPIKLKNKEEVMDSLRQIDIRAESLNKKLDQISVKMTAIESIGLAFETLGDGLSNIIKTLSKIDIKK